jgi:hypothetical protein
VFTTSISGNDGARALSTARPALGVWTHLTGTFDSATGAVSLFVDGVAQQGATAGAQSSGGVFTVGRAVGGEWFAGTVDEVRVYDVVLPAADVRGLANQAVERSRYLLDEGAGAMAVDSVTGAQAPLSGSATWDVVDGHPALRFSGALPGEVTAPRPADFRTDRSYAVSAFVQLDLLSVAARTAVSIGDPNFSPFLLQYRPEKQQWGFLTTCDPLRPCGETVLSTEPASDWPNGWVHLVGVHDATTGENRLYVNGTFSARLPSTPTWNNDGNLIIGRAQFSSQAADPWPGAVDDVRLFTGVPSDNDIVQMSVHL